MNGIKKHEYLLEEEFYEFNHIGTKARSDKWCGHCGKIIPKGEPHLVSKFYPEFEGPAIHTNCEEEFLKSLK
jgi:hypothetical protein